MPTRLFMLSAILALVLSPVQFAHAQRSGGSGMSAFGNSMSGMGGGMGGSGGFGNSMGGMSGGMGGSGGFGSSGMGGMGGGMGNSSFGRSGGGNSSFGNSGFGNSSGFGGGQQGGGTSFVGRDATDMQGTFQQTSKAQTQFFNNMNRQMSRNNNRDRKSKTTSNPAQPMRMEVKVAFNPVRPTSDAVAARVQNRLSKILADHNMTQPLITVQGDAAVISGAAASDNERQVIGKLVALESGVRSVRNEMTVASATTEDIAPPSGN